MLTRLAILLLLLTAGLSPALALEPGSEVGPAQIEQILRDYLAANRERLPAAKIGIKSFQPPPPFTLPAGQLSHEVIPSDPGILASRRFTILFRVDGRVVQNLPVRAEIEALAPVVVAAHDLGRGIELADSDLRMVEMDLNGLRNPCIDPGELLGKRLKRPLRAGDPLDRTQVEFPPMIRRGEAVSIQVVSGALRITAAGEARQDGREGETIRVRNSSSRKEILCRVLAPGLAQVEF
ncbi:hypothetical protein DESUT3_36800 [Desulfuromonas versatilis]|uniref:Flagella basal body P-ring formation protein FlgA n=1 Tax=Desulfuromonas versatilis TaxID=2802975 RepID=A0ABM8I165_9BACT|nr:flagellar basal body P-ring formation chaperone FlgA [Desulfuromonas versatilis]BCR06611.1 hypothetical protein DESUT3_36800 [Desulfuromonas versatilis]